MSEAPEDQQWRSFLHDASAELADVDRLRASASALSESPLDPQRQQQVRALLGERESRARQGRVDRLLGGGCE